MSAPALRPEALAPPASLASPAPVPLYAGLLGADWERLPLQVRRLHGEGHARGHFHVRRGPGPLVTLLGGLLRLPPAGEHVPTRLAVRGAGGHQSWERVFGTHVLVTEQHAWPGGLLAERLGPVVCVFRLRAGDTGLRYEQVDAWLYLGPLRLRLPRALAPRVEAEVTDAPDGMRVSVRIGAPVVGRLLSYEGQVRPEPEEAS